jgi:hypothetical protein
MKLSQKQKVMIHILLITVKREINGKVYYESYLFLKMKRIRYKELIIED